jgi:uncharacterized NAD-dependent epimerase/dehydratase family protein
MDLTRATYLILAEGSFGIHTSKTATSAIRYLPERVAAVVDSTNAGRDAEEVLGIGRGIPVVASVAEGLARGRIEANALLVGIAPRGGKLPAGAAAIIAEAASHGLDIISGLHEFLADEPMIRDAAEAAGVTICDLRRPPAELPVSTGLARLVEPFNVLMVGTDCNLGKMTAGLEIRRGLEELGERVSFAPTGQTGIMIEGWGIAVDAVISDFTAGAAERLVLEGAERAGPEGIVLVEGQGSLIHPGYSGVTLGLLHGSLPEAMILCHDAARTHIRGDGAYDFVTIPPLADMVKLYEDVAGWLRPARVLGIALKTNDLSEVAAREAIARSEAETGLPATDAVRFGPGPLAEVIHRAAVDRRAARHQSALRPALASSQVR